MVFLEKNIICLLLQYLFFVVFLLCAKALFDRLQKERFSSMKKIVVVGGGSGSFSVLQGLKGYPYDITAVATTFDSGMHTGEIRDRFGTLPSGDVRRQILALAPEDHSSILRGLFMFRYEEPEAKFSKSLGNLMLMAAEKITGDPVAGIKAISELFQIRGRVLPVSTDDAHVCVELKDGTVIRGESNIDKPKHDGSIPIVSVYLEPEALIYRETYEVTRDANLLVVSPGDLYSSLSPIFVVNGYTDAVQECKGMKVCVANLMTKWGETNGYTVADCARVLTKYLGIPKFDAVICNSKPLDPGLLKKYAEEKAFPMAIDEAILRNYAGNIIKAPIADETGGIIRHNSRELARILKGCVP